MRINGYSIISKKDYSSREHNQQLLKKFNAENVTALVQFISGNGKSNFNIVTNINDFSFQHNDSEFVGPEIYGEISKEKFTLFADEMYLNEMELENINITKLRKENFYQASFDKLFIYHAVEPYYVLDTYHLYILFY